MLVARPIVRGEEDARRPGDPCVAGPVVRPFAGKRTKGIGHRVVAGAAAGRGRKRASDDRWRVCEEDFSQPFVAPV